jgi:hypothetical protein
MRLYREERRLAEVRRIAGPVVDLRNPAVVRRILPAVLVVRRPVSKIGQLTLFVSCCSQRPRKAREDEHNRRSHRLVGLKVGIQVRVNIPVFDHTAVRCRVPDSVRMALPGLAEAEVVSSTVVVVLRIAVAGRSHLAPAVGS